ncbi:hypothetical protein Gohar_022001 [Gossypium harknessii]|uniref:Uncharacterized protein n=1 Tax=Gossypium harknessii TaxID=34285 RepID=A0A7J9IBT4_9ROSI|nr:hypothetical protein [Gossypium harknessii]
MLKAKPNLESRIRQKIEPLGKMLKQLLMLLKK